MTEFSTTSKRLSEIDAYLDGVSSSSCCLEDAKAQMDAIDLELNEAFAARMRKFRARVEEPDESKRVYGKAMAAKVYQLLEDYDNVVKRFRPVYERACQLSTVAQAERSQALLLQRFSDLYGNLLMEELSLRAALEEEEAKVAEVVGAQFDEGKARLEVRRRQLERQAVAERLKAEEEQRKAEAAAAEQRRQAEAEAHARQLKEHAREQRKRRVEEIVAVHRNLQGKSEEELLQEAIAQSLLEEEARQRARVAKNSSSSSAASSSSSSPEGSLSGGSPPEAPPAVSPGPVPLSGADLDTEERLLKDAALKESLSRKPMEPHSDKQAN